MDATLRGAWHPLLRDPLGQRHNGLDAQTGHHDGRNVQLRGQTMVIDKGLGRQAYSDFIESAAPYVDYIKLGFGTSPLYSRELLAHKIELARACGVHIMPGGTLLEIAVSQGVTDEFFATINSCGFTAIEVSDGTIEMSRQTRSRLIRQGLANGLTVLTEYGKKTAGTRIDAQALVATAEADWEAGATLVTVEARESGMGVGLFDEQGHCDPEHFTTLLTQLPNTQGLLWEAPLKAQQTLLLEALGPQVHLGNIRPEDVITLEAMRRGLRSDTFRQVKIPVMYMI